ncbi:MAG: phosphoadenosine phosphosulfate reductase [Methanocalculus sp. MSAO_Arc1]|uniref:phosphoadenosine phosphosulfate reductase domain-containing protein n=1 Tax=Methanocalculus TaxID=71151 RepID=UPI000FED263D|nr:MULTISPECIES: phosphoadenosine phosphosulfate reductase family protein [unclassified Methanocalculus]MCP1662784.1 phosphoadenosine phosphosulfate reductase [Methanocalculus sp. AMF5]RQD81073.1 MAG: phosphoadenosine phosphosulfate reductase [Methanocalculus sp. MSAO_Arc1]
MKSLFAGVNPLHWCDSCHVPVLGRRCGCGGSARQVEITPPGDVRPAFPQDIGLINSIFEEAFGTPLIPPGHLALLNKVPDTDRMEEIILGGAVVGAIRYLPEERRWEALPRIHSALHAPPQRGYVVVSDDAASFISSGSSVLAPGVVRVDPDIRKGDEVFVLTPDGACIGVGRAKMSGDEARAATRGQVVRLRKNSPQTYLPGAATWEDAVSANAGILSSIEGESIRFIQECVSAENLPLTVSYSGGKDSLATLLVTHKAVGPVPLLFADTGLEFPETVENVQTVAEAYGLPVYMAYGEDGFWEGFSRHGPPAVDLRWCCKACKLTPVRDTIEQEWGRCISAIGQRKYESARRRRSRRVWQNPNVPNQLSIAPIQHWNALHVWLYIFRENAPYNRLYELGLDRIGCYMCPSTDRAHFQMIESRYPQLWEKWRSAVTAFAKRSGRSEDWFESGAWRIHKEQIDDEDSHY